MITPDRITLEHRQPKVLHGVDTLQRLDNPAVISTTIPVFLVIATLGADKTQAGTTIPIASLLLGALVMISSFVRPIRGLLRPNWGVWLTLAIPIWMAITTALNGVNGTKRVVNIGMEALLILVISSGRVCVISIARGAAVAVIAGTAWAYATFSRSSYPGRLTGGWGDPNNAGMCILALGAIAIAYSRTNRTRALIGIFCIVGVVGTLSRTSLFGLLIVGIWVTAGERIPTWIRLAVIGVLIWYVTTLPQSDFTAGAFAGREGSDALRQRIDEAAQASVQIHPLTGNGAGTAQTTVQGETFFFHNSYEALRAEGGWILLGLVVLLITLSLFALLRLPREYRNRWVEASLIGPLVCAISLGEVFLAPPVMLAVGVALRHIAVSRRRMNGGLSDPESVNQDADLSQQIVWSDKLAHA
ncbi:hypothetical protein V3G39_08030 [Dermatophilaceae bacterium Sec6.4]